MDYLWAIQLGGVAVGTCVSLVLDSSATCPGYREKDEFFFGVS